MAEKCLRKCAKCSDSHHPVHAQNLIRGFLSPFKHSVDPVLLGDSRGPEQTTRMRKLNWVFTVRICPRQVFTWRGPHNTKIFYSQTVRTRRSSEDVRYSQTDKDTVGFSQQRQNGGTSDFVSMRQTSVRTCYHVYITIRSKLMCSLDQILSFIIFVNLPGFKILRCCQCKQLWMGNRVYYLWRTMQKRVLLPVNVCKIVRICGQFYTHLQAVRWTCCREV